MKPLDFKLKFMCEHGLVGKLEKRIEGYKNWNIKYNEIIEASSVLFPSSKNNETIIYEELLSTFKIIKKSIWRKIIETFRF